MLSGSRVEYEDFRLLVEGAGGGYLASVLESPAGETTTATTVHWSAEVGRLLKEDELHRAGGSLFDAFIRGEIVELYRESVARAQERRRGLRLKLTLGPRELVRAPWELLYDTRNRCYVGLSTRTPIVRHPRVPRPMETLTVEPPLRILGMVANPRAPNLPRLNVARERKLIDKALAQLVEHGLVYMRWLDRGTGEELRSAVVEGWHAFHFCGHGDYDAELGEGYLVLENEAGGPVRLRAADLGLLLREEGGVRLAVLNCCKGASADTRLTSLSCADALVGAGMGGVVAMQNPISDRAATTFARVGYLAIASRLPLDAALGSARAAMKLVPRGPIEWWTPVLHLRAKSGDLFELPPKAPAEALVRIKGAEYLGPNLDSRMEKALSRRKRLSAIVSAWVVAPVPLVAFLLATRIPSDVVSADVEASAASFTLSSEREVFSELPRVRSFKASGFAQVSLPGSLFPSRPDETEAELHAAAADSSSWIVLQPWLLPAGSRITLDHTRGAAAGEYAVSVAAGAGQRFNLALLRRIRLSRFGAPAELHDYADTSSVELLTGPGSLDVELQARNLSDITLPPLMIDSLELQRQGFGDAGPLSEPTVLRARLRFNGQDLVLNTTSLSLGGLGRGAVEKIRLIPRGIAFNVTGPVEAISVRGNPLPFPSRLEWLRRERPSSLWLGALTYVLVLLAGALSWRMIHVARATEQ